MSAGQFSSTTQKRKEAVRGTSLGEALGVTTHALSTLLWKLDIHTKVIMTPASTVLSS